VKREEEGTPEGGYCGREREIGKLMKEAKRNGLPICLLRVLTVSRGGGPVEEIQSFLKSKIK